MLHKMISQREPAASGDKWIRSQLQFLPGRLVQGLRIGRAAYLQSLYYCILAISSVPLVKTLGFPRLEFAHACSSLARPAAETPEPYTKLGDDLLPFALDSRPLMSHQMRNPTAASRKFHAPVTRRQPRERAEKNRRFYQLAPSSLAIEKPNQQPHR